MQTQPLATALLQEFALLHHQSSALPVPSSIGPGGPDEESEEGGSDHRGEEGSVGERSVLGVADDAGHEETVDGGEDGGHESSQGLFDHEVLGLGGLVGLEHEGFGLGDEALDAGDVVLDASGVLGDEAAKEEE
mmetsp:Transcript_24293/g.50400  ORF Transcript_24293/g.50400 Transcript_24293/m.50400 type:complete len:134 (-) Transcript_24293:1023-1424(-)